MGFLQTPFYKTEDVKSDSFDWLYLYMKPIRIG